MSNHQSEIICVFTVSKMVEKEIGERENDRKGKLKRERERDKKEKNIASFVIDSEIINQWNLD